MPRYPGDPDREHRVVLRPFVRRVFFSRAEASQGEVVTLHVETRHAPDGAAVTLTLVDALGARSEVPGPHAVSGGRLVVEHTLSAQDGADGASPPPVLLLVLEATLTDWGVSARSEPLRLDTGGFVLSI